MDHDGQQVARGHDAGLEQVGPYTLIAQIAGGDFATVHLAQKQGPLGFHRLAAIKRLKPEIAKQPEWTQLLLDEARFSAVVRHFNIVDVLDVGTDAGVYIVMDYVEGADLEVLIARAGKERHPRYLVPPIVDALTGLHALHTAQDELGESLAMVHQAPLARHILVGIDGISRITDFGQVSARGLLPSALRSNRLAAEYMAPEQVTQSEPVSARTDLFIAGITLWETLTGERLFQADSPALARRAITERHIARPSEVGLKPPRCFDDICLKALQRNPDQRYQSASEMARELREVALDEALYASSGELGQWVRALASRALVARRRALGSDAPSQEILLDPPPLSTRVQVAFTPAGAATESALRPSALTRAANVHSSSPVSETMPIPSLPFASALHHDQSDSAVSDVQPIADDPSRVSRSYTVPVTTPPSAAPSRRAITSSLSKTLMGISPRPVGAGRIPPPALAATMGYDSANRAGSSAPQVLHVGSGPSRAPSALPTHRYNGSVPHNVTLPEGSLLRDLRLPSSPSRASAVSSMAGAFGGAAQQHEQAEASFAARGRATSGSGKFRAPSPSSSSFGPAGMHRYPAVGSSTHSESLGYGQGYAMAPGATQQPRDDAGDSFRPPAFGSAHESDWPEHEEQESAKGLRVSSLLFIGTLLALGFFGYRHYAPNLLRSNEVEPTFGAAPVELPPEPDAVEVADPAAPNQLVEPQNPAEQQVAPVAPVEGTPALAPAADVVRTAEPVPAARAVPVRPAPARRAVAAPVRAPVQQPAVRRPMRMMPREQNDESLPDNPY